MVDKEITFVTISKPPVAVPQEITESDWTDLLADMAILQAGYSLGDLNDVDVSGAADGYALTYNAGDDKYELTEIAGAVETVTDTDSVDLTLASGDLQAAVKYAGTGTANTAARSDHSLSAPPGKRDTFAATGVLSSGTRTLVSTTVGPLTSGYVYDIDARFVVRARNNVNSGTFNLLCRVGSESGYPQLSRNVQTVGGVPADQEIIFGDDNGDMVFTGTGSSIAVTFSAQFSSGDPVDLRDGFWRVKCAPRR